jgi:hypothetical protein
MPLELDGPGLSCGRVVSKPKKAMSADATRNIAIRPPTPSIGASLPHAANEVDVNDEVRCLELEALALGCPRR